MKVLLVNGSPHERGCTYTALREAADAIEKRGIETEILWLGKGEIPGCMGCGAVLSVPKGKGKLRVTGPKCHWQTEKKS